MEAHLLTYLLERFAFNPEMILHEQNKTTNELGEKCN